jgi:hypothetical protein
VDGYGLVRVHRNEEREARRGKLNQYKYPARTKGKIVPRLNTDTKAASQGLAAPSLNLATQHAPERKTCPGIGPLSVPSS